MLERMNPGLLVAPNVQEWLDMARWAPSGGNAQPWKVQWRFSSGVLEIFLKICQDYQKQPSSMDLEGKASALSLGCLAKNLEIAAEKEGFALVATQLFEGQSIWESSARLEFCQTHQRRTSLYNAMINRKTDRNQYRTDELPSQFLEELKTLKEKNSSILVHEFKADRKNLISPLIKVEKLRWSNDYLINGMLKEICFDQNGFNQGVGIPVWQLGIGSFDQFLMRALKQWPMLRKLFKLGIASMPAKKSLHLPIINSNRIIFLECTENRFQNWYWLGKMFQDIWIQASACGLSFQPLSQSLIIEGFWSNPEYSILNEVEKAVVQEVTETLNSQFNMNFKNPVIGFRLGITIKEEGRSSRKKIIALSLQRD